MNASLEDSEAKGVVGKFGVSGMKGRKLSSVQK